MKLCIIGVPGFVKFYLKQVKFIVGTHFFVAIRVVASCENNFVPFYIISKDVGD